MGKHWTDATIKLTAYGIGLATLLVFWAQISGGMAGCYAAVSENDAPPPLQVGGREGLDTKDETPPPPPGSVRVKVLSGEKK